WSGGSFGYFPSYALGNMYAAQMMHSMRKGMPDLDARIENGELAPIKAYLTEHVYQYGKLKTPSDIIQSMTGEALNPQYLVDYLTKKTKEVYQLS
ncbi:MAG: carboxypeptidase M32, partial [Paenibacillus sp.]|nr:carboxypeptidase M32 [Paenibacillus sp.]